MDELKYFGALPDFSIKQLIEDEYIKNGDQNCVGTDTIDPVISEEIYRIPQVFMPLSNERVCEFARKYGKRIERSNTFESGVCYLIKLKESISRELPFNLYGYGNPKSNIGRIDTLVRFVVDGVSRYDFIPRGYVGDLWVMIVPNSFPIIVPEKFSFNQFRFLNKNTRLTEDQLKTAFNSDGGLLYSKNSEKIEYKNILHSDKDGSILLSLGLDFCRVGFEAVPNGEPIDLSKINFYNPKDFWREIHTDNGSINLGPNQFSILSSEEFVRVFPTLACEMRPMDDRSGEFRVHYAGFIAPGWGYGSVGQERGRPLTLEVRSYEPIRIRRGQPVAKIRFEMMAQEPDVHYDMQSSTKFKVQDGPCLAKYFKSW